MKLPLPLSVFALLAVFCAPQARARLDETLQQCTNRYGKPFQISDNHSDYGIEGTKDYYFKKDGFQVVVTIFQGHAANMIFTKESNAAFSDAEIQALLNANKGVSSWGAVEKSSDMSEDGKPTLFWTRADGASATYIYVALSTTHSLLFNNKAYKDERDRIIDARIAADKKKQGGDKTAETMKGF